MSFVNVVGAGLWIPNNPGDLSLSPLIASSDSALIDADEEEFQIIGTVHIDGGGSKTFGTSSKVNWLTGASITFAANSTLRVGVKQASSIDNTAGPSARATIGAAAFDVYKDLVGGTDTLSSTTAQPTQMANGSLAVDDGDEIAICFHLDTSSGSPSVKIRMGATLSATVQVYPVCTLVTSGPTYTPAALISNVVLEFDDGSLGWIEPTYAFSVADVASSAIGNGNIFGNVFQVPYPCKVDMIAAQVNATTSAADFALELYSDPLGTPTLVESLAFDANVVAANNTARWVRKQLTTPRTLTINTDYAIGVKQTTATNVTTAQTDVNVAAHFKAQGMGAECYAANSTAGAAFASQNSGKRRYKIYARISALDNGTSPRPQLHIGGL